MGTRTGGAKKERSKKKKKGSLLVQAARKGLRCDLVQGGRRGIRRGATRKQKKKKKRLSSFLLVREGAEGGAGAHWVNSKGEKGSANRNKKENPVTPRSTRGRRSLGGRKQEWSDERSIEVRPGQVKSGNTTGERQSTGS